MMKKFSLLVSTILCALLLASCNMISNVGYVTGGKEKSTLTLSVASFIPSRTVLPNDWTEPRKEGLKYKLTGSKTANGSNEINGSNIFTWDQLKNGTAVIDLDPVMWYLVLTAYQFDSDGTLTEIALVSPQTTVDLTGGSTSQTFALAAVDSTNATGDVEFTVTFPKPERFAKVTYGLYTSSDFSASTLVTGATEVTTNDADLTVVNAAQNKYKISYSASGIKAAKENMWVKAAFYNDDNKCIGFFAEDVWVDGGNLSSKNFSLEDNFFNTDPDPVTNFAVSYSYNQNGLNPAEFEYEQNVENKYFVTFTWDDNSNNETGFELIIDNGTGMQTLAIPASTESFAVPIDFTTGTVYSAKLRAVNSFSKARNADGANFAEIPEICLYTVTYNLNNGIVKTGNDSETTAGYESYVVPYVKSASAVALMTDDTSAFPYVYRTGYNFVEWNDGTSAVTEVAADNSANVVVNAVWSSTLGINASFPTYGGYDTQLVNATGEYLEVNGVLPNGETRASVTLTASAAASDVAYTVYDNVDYSTVLYSVAAGESFNWIITDESDADSDNWLYRTGSYRVAVSGTVNGATVTGNFYIKVIR